MDRRAVVCAADGIANVAAVMEDSPMVLSSQMPRPVNRWRHMTNERRRARRPWIVILLLVAVGVPLIWFVWRGFGSDGTTATNGSGDGASAGSGDGAGGAAATPPVDAGADRTKSAPTSSGTISQG